MRKAHYLVYNKFSELKCTVKQLNKKSLIVDI